MGQARDWPRSPDWPKIVREVKAAGYTWDTLADLCGLERTCLAHVARGRTKRVEYSVGVALLELHERYVQNVNAKSGGAAAGGASSVTASVSGSSVVKG